MITWSDTTVWAVTPPELVVAAAAAGGAVVAAAGVGGEAGSVITVVNLGLFNLVTAWFHFETPTVFNLKSPDLPLVLFSVQLNSEDGIFTV